MSLRFKYYARLRQATVAAMLLMPAIAHAQSDTGSPFDFDHILTYVVAALLIGVFVLFFYNRLFVYREQEANNENLRQNNQLALVLKTGRLQVWAYNTATRHYQILSETGDFEQEYNPIDYAAFYDRDDFEVLRSAIFDISENRRLTTTVDMRSNPLLKGQQHFYTVNVSIARRNAKGQVEQILGIQRDVTEEQLKREKAKQLMLRYHTVFNSSLVDMIYYDKNGVLADINETACQSFNVKNRADVLNGEYSIHDNPMYNSIDLEDLTSTRTTAIVDFDQYPPGQSRENPNGMTGKMYYESTINSIRNRHGELEGFYMAGRNVTEMVESFHHQQEGSIKLKKATKDIQSYINNIDYSMQVSDARLVNYYPDKFTLEIIDSVSKSSMRLSQLRCIRLATPRYRRTVSSVLNRMDHLTERSIEQTIETEIRDEKGRQIALMFSMVPLINSQGKVERYFGMCRVMTDMVETERQLAIETKKAQEAEQIKSSFLTNMSYEIRTPLNAVLGFAELFEQEHDPADEATFVEEIKRNTNSLLLLINDILFLSRLDANMIEFNPQNVDLAEMFDAYCQMGWSSVSPNVKTVIENAYEHLVICIDINQLGQVIQKLCTNATNFTHEGSIRARYEYRRGELSIAIEDTGVGIDPETLPHVFDRFARNREEKLCGTGLDLPIVQSIVHQMGGTIEIQSDLGKGTSVWVTIPCEASTIERKRDITV